MLSSTRFFNRQNIHSTEDLARFATIGQTQAAPHLSTKYAFIPTSRALTVLQDYGWQPAQAMEARALSDEKRGFQKHLVRLNNPSLCAGLAVGSTAPQLILTNSHCGNASFELMLGLFEQVCSNGLVVRRESLDSLRITHRRFDESEMETAIRQITDSIPDSLTKTDQFKTLRLTESERLAFGAAAIELRWNGEEFAVDPVRLMLPKRTAERDANLWNTLNIAQEKVIRGGVDVRSLRLDANGKPAKPRRARAVTSINENIRLNQALWVLAEEMAKLKK